MLLFDIIVSAFFLGVIGIGLGFSLYAIFTLFTDTIRLKSILFILLLPVFGFFFWFIFQEFLWRLYQLLTHLPALELTPEGIINNTVLYRVSYPWKTITHMRWRHKYSRIFVSLLSEPVLLPIARRMQVFSNQRHDTYGVFQDTSRLMYINGLRSSPQQIWEMLQQYAQDYGPEVPITFDERER
jgi:hypothetical protein